MATIEPDEYRRIVAFLQALDGKARHKATLYVIGGAAVTLAYAPDNRNSVIVAGGSIGHCVKIPAAFSYQPTTWFARI